MNKKDILELKKRFTKDRAGITRVTGCYVNADREKVTVFNENFLNLEDEEMFKYLEIAKKTLSGKVGDNSLTLDMHEGSSCQKSLLALKESQLKDNTFLDSFYDSVIENYECEGNYLIVLFHDVYDIIKKSSDHLSLDESEEVYEYILCAICPVKLSKPGLGYRENENRIGSRLRDWIVCVPETGFVYPAFTDRSSDIHAAMLYTKDVKNPHKEFVQQILGCEMKMTASQKREIMSDIIHHSVDNEDVADRVYYELQESISSTMDESKDMDDRQEVDIKELMTSCSVNEDQIAEIEKEYKEQFDKEETPLEQLYDKKAEKELGVELEKRELVKSRESMKDLLREAAMELDRLNGSETELTIKIRNLLENK